ncbi:MAG: two-component regulator propeller domain-containing protein [Pyrinomonadaceae bacterium]
MAFLYLQRKNLVYFKRKILWICRLLSFCLIFLFVSPIFPQYRFENWSTEQGLPYKTVRGVLQTSDGYLWAATSDGLARFDGVRFTVFNTANSPGLKTNRLDNLAETLDGSLWLSGEEGLLFRFRDGAFSFLSTAEGLPSDVIFSIYADRRVNRLTILTQRGIAVWQDEKIVSVEHFLEPLRPFTALLDNTGAYCVKEKNVLRRRTAAGIDEYKLPEDLSETDLTAVYEDRAGAVWIGVLHPPLPSKAKLYVFKNDRISVFDERDGLPNAFIQKILEDHEGSLWVATGQFEEGGLVKIENGKLRSLSKGEGFNGTGVLDLTEDSEGALWAGISDSGLTRITPRFITNFTSDKNGLSSDNIYPLYEDPNGEIWSGSWRYGKELNGGIDKFEDGVFKHFARENQITSLSPTSLFKDREGNLWIGAYAGLTKYKDGKFTRYTKETGFMPEHISAITQTRDGTLWFGALQGLTRLQDNQFTEFTTAGGLPHNDTRNLYEARDGTLWIATMGGLGSYKDGRFTNYTEFPAVEVRSIYEDADGALWFGTYDAGVFRFRNGEFKAITIKDGLFDQGAFQILEDDFGRFWISSNRGIYRVSRQQLNDFADRKIQTVTSVAHGVKDGMVDAECNGGRSPAGFKSRRDGTLWFPTQKGIVVIDPKLLPTMSEPPNVVIENCLLDGKESACEDIKILPENESLEIKYTGLSFNNPEQIKFIYKLEGLDENWVDAGTRRRAFFTHLPPGEYAFRVSAANVDGVWNERGASLKIMVKPPFYRTYWFLSLSILTCAGILFFLYRRRVKNLEQRRAAQEEFSRKLLESQEQERQRIAGELHDSLGQNLLVIKNWALIGMKNGADSSQQLTEISETASVAINEVREIAYNLRPYHLNELGLTKAVESMLERVAKSSTINFVWEIDLIDGFCARESEINFYRIVQECLNNIIKHSGASEAGVKIRRSENEGVTLLVWDNGKGFDTNSMALKRASQSGFGMAGISERARILGGKIVINSTPNEGTTVKLTFVC